MILTVAAVVAAITHLGVGLAIAAALLRRRPGMTETPLISIVVPARNEAHNLPRLFSSLRKLRYPADKIELIVVNDDSTDNTAQVAENLGRSLPYTLKVVSADHGAHEVLPLTKTLPLAQGIDVAQGAYVLMTDGDCEVPPDWARDIVDHFETGIGMVCGITLPDYNATPNPVTKLEAVDWTLLLGVCAGMCRLGRPLALVGNNYAVRREAYYDVGTFRNIAHNRIDDIALFRAIAESEKWRIAFAVTPGATVATLPVAETKAIVKQRYRWMEGYPAVKVFGKLLFGFGVMTHLLWPLALLLPAPFGVAVIIAILLGDWSVIAATLSKVKKQKLIAATFGYPLFAFAYGWRLIGALIKREEVMWKERKLA